MMWLAWRQHRASIAAGLGTLVVLAVFLVLSGNSMRSAFVDLGLDKCTIPTSDTCSQASIHFQQQFAGYQFLLPLLLVLPVLVGVFWGAPLVARELEQGTHRLVWTQSITRRRWLSVKVALLVGALLIGFAALTALVGWWAAPILDVRPQRFDPGLFDLLGVAPLGYALLAFAIGVAAGTLTKKLVPAIGITVVAFLVLRVGIEFGLRPHYMAPISITVAFPAGADAELPHLPSGWIVDAQTLDGNGRVISDGVGIEFGPATADCPEVAATGPDAPPDRSAMAACARRSSFHVVATYQPEDRYWRFQATEAAICVLISGALIVGSGWWLRRRVT